VTGGGECVRSSTDIVNNIVLKRECECARKLLLFTDCILLLQLQPSLLLASGFPRVLFPLLLCSPPRCLGAVPPPVFRRRFLYAYDHFSTRCEPSAARQTRAGSARRRAPAPTPPCPTPPRQTDLLPTAHQQLLTVLTVFLYTKINIKIYIKYICI